MRDAVATLFPLSLQDLIGLVVHKRMGFESARRFCHPNMDCLPVFDLRDYLEERYEAEGEP